MPTLHETFNDRASADRAIEDLIANGISPDDISIVMSSTAKPALLPELDGNIAKGGVAGAVALGGLGALSAGLVLVAATGGLAAPLLVAGPLAGVLAGGVSGVAVGTLIGGLCGAGVAENDAHVIESHINDGAVAVVVQATTANAPDIDEILRKDDAGKEPSRG